MTDATPAPDNYNPKWEDVEFPNPDISSKKWNFNYDDAKALEKTVGALLPFASIVLFFALFSKFSPLGKLFDGSDVSGIIYIAIFLGMLVSSFFIAVKLSKRMVKKRNSKRDEYRAANAATIIDALAEQGWKIVGKDAVQTLIKDDNPYLVNKNGVRYYARQFYIGQENVTFMVELRDEGVEKEMADKEKQSRIDFMLKRYEDANGVMSPETRSAFVEGAKMSLHNQVLR